MSDVGQIQALQEENEQLKKKLSQIYVAERGVVCIILLHHIISCSSILSCIISIPLLRSLFYPFCSSYKYSHLLILYTHTPGIYKEIETLQRQPVTVDISTDLKEMEGRLHGVQAEINRSWKRRCAIKELTKR